MRIGDTVRLRPDTSVCRRYAELANVAGQVGDLWERGGETRCTVIYEVEQQLVLDVPAEAFEPTEAER